MQIILTHYITDSLIFQYNKNVRNKIRKTLNLQNKYGEKEEEKEENKEEKTNKKKN